MAKIKPCFYQPDQKFNNKITWEGFRNLSNWDDVITQFQYRIENFFFSPIRLLYECSSSGKIIFVHNFPISNICWSLLELFTQLESKNKVVGINVDNFLSQNEIFFKNIKKAIGLANPTTVYDIFRNKPIHNAMVRGLGGLDHLTPDVFTITKKNLNINGTLSTRETITENPIKLFEAIMKYFNAYITKLRISKDLKKKFKARIQKLFEFQFTCI